MQGTSNDSMTKSKVYYKKNPVVDKRRGKSVIPPRYANAQDEFDEVEMADSVPQKLVLVPDRWSHTGWKYVTDDPGKNKFFSSPNRVNNYGFGYEKKAHQSRNKSLYGDEYQTSYKNFFA